MDPAVAVLDALFALMAFLVFDRLGGEYDQMSAG
jgi:hypothetical protein